MEYTVIRSNRRTVALEITRDLKIVVRAPKQMPKKEIERFVAGHAEWISVHYARQAARVQAHPEPTAQETALLKQKAKDILPQKVAYYAERMGVQPTGVRITSAKRRFGSCSAKNALCFSWRLMQYPEAAVDYVVVHELAHITQHNHSAAFYRVVQSVMPDYKEREKLLRE
ncbi:MAG: M48 family metallopeptidase [Clostridia bacterium]|nr:M48 family metallopeptidase [Clostridia bacterium]